MTKETTIFHKELGSLRQIANSLAKLMSEEIDKNGYSDTTLHIEGAYRGIHEIVNINNLKEVSLLNQVKQGDLVVERGEHSCNVKFVEGADETGILLVDGVKDEYFEAEDGGLERFYEKYKLLCKKENMED